MNAVEIVRHVAIHVATDQRRMAEELVRNALNNAQNDAEPRLKELEDEVAKLKECLASNYSPRSVNWTQWGKHCDEIDAAGGTPPDETGWRVELALAEWEKWG